MLTTVSSGSNKSVSGFPIPHATRTKTGITNSAIWMQLPTATLIAKSNLPLLATITAVVCSAALPIMGMMMSVIHSFDTEGCAATRPSSESTKYSAVTYARAVTTTRRISAEIVFNFGASSPVDEDDVTDAVDADDGATDGRGRVGVVERRPQLEDVLKPVEMLYS